MPRYFFDIYDGLNERDHNGTELPNVDAARVEALRYVGELLSDETRRHALSDDWRMEVKDATGTTYLHLEFQVIETRAAEQARANGTALSPAT